MSNENNLGIDHLLNAGGEDDGIPEFLRKQAPVQEAIPEVQPEFTTVENSDGQVELTIDEQANALLGTLTPQQEPEPEPGELIAHSQPETEQHANNVDAATSAGNDESSMPAHGQNSPGDPAELRRDFFKDVNKFGKASGEGASALGRLGLRCLRAAADGAISSAKPAGGGKDDATLIYEAYAAMDSKHAEHTAGGAKANASKLRQVIAMGCMTTLSDPVAVGDRVVAIRERMEGAELKPKALFAALVDVARDQLASDTELSDAAIEAALIKTKAEKTLEKEWTAIQKKVEGLITGEASHGLKDTSDTALKISDLCIERLKQYKSDDTRADLIAAMVENGYTEAQATAIVDKKIELA